MIDMSTNLTPSQLNYDKYTDDQYDRDIVNSIPHHKEMHELMAGFIKGQFDREKEYQILDLGVGTGITAKIVQDLLPKAKFDVIDFSEQMMDGAKKKLGTDVNYILADYSQIELEPKYDLIVSAISLHHQNNEGKQKMFENIWKALVDGGVFIFGDLVTYRDEHEAALNLAKHLHHLVEHATDEQTLKEWAHHHQYLNDLAPIEDQIEWLEAVGFKVKKAMLKINTALLICEK